MTHPPQRDSMKRISMWMERTLIRRIRRACELLREVEGTSLKWSAFVRRACRSEVARVELAHARIRNERRAALPPGWQEHHTHEGIPFYERPDGSTTWDPPPVKRGGA